MNTPLKDLPKFAERIENNYCIKEDILAALRDFENDDFLSDNDTLDTIMQTVTEFINQNYTFKGI